VVTWNAIAGGKVIVELRLEDFATATRLKGDFKMTVAPRKVTSRHFLLHMGKEKK